MTKLNGKSLTREIPIRLMGTSRPMIFTLDGANTRLLMREKGSRREFYFPLETACIQSAQMGWIVKK